MQDGAKEQAGTGGVQVAAGRAAALAPAGGRKAGQSLALGFVAGVAAAAVGAALWAAISYTTEYQIGWMAVGVGFLVGIAVRRLGKGTDAMFGIVGGALALAGCLAGNLFTICLVLAREKAMSLLDVVSRLNFGIVAELMQATFSPMDLLFYGIAIYEAYRFAVVRDEEAASSEKPA